MKKKILWFLGVLTVLMVISLPFALPALWRFLWRQAFDPEFFAAAGFGGNQMVLSVAVSADGKWIAAGTLGNLLTVWETQTGRPCWSRRMEGSVCSLAFSPREGTLLLSPVGDKAGLDQACLWDVQTGQIRRVFPGEDSFCVAFSPDGSLVALGGDGKVSVRETQTGRPCHSFPMRDCWVRAVAFSPDGKLLAAGGGNPHVGGLPPVVVLWDLSKDHPARTLEWPKEPSEYPDGPGHCVRALAFSPDGRYLTVAPESRNIFVWDLQSGAVCLLVGHESWTEGLAFTPDGQQLVSVNEDHTIKVWDFAAGQPVRTLRKHWGDVSAVSMGPDGTWFASGGSDGTVRVWDLRKGRCRRTLIPEAPKPE
jgi:WD40 repeat protein